jgi:hypothetical protein
MKRLTILLLSSGGLMALLLTGCASAGSSVAAKPEVKLTPVVFQASTFTKEDGGTVKPQKGRVDANGDVLINWNNAGHWLEWTVDIPNTGNYEFCFRVAAGRAWETYRDLKIDGQSPGADFDKIVFATTGGFARDKNDWANVVVKDAKGRPVLVNLTKGSHIIRMTNLGGAEGDGACNFDTIAIAPKDYDLSALGKVAAPKAN